MHSLAPYQTKIKLIAVATSLLLFALFISLWLLMIKQNVTKSSKEYLQYSVAMIDTVLDSAKDAAESSVDLLHKSCHETEPELRVKLLQYQFIRSINLIENWTVYCSSLLPKINYQVEPTSFINNQLKLAKGNSPTPNTPLLDYLHRAGKYAVLTTIDARNLKPNINIEGKTGEFFIIVGDRWFSKDAITEGQLPKEYLTFLKTPSEKYPFTIMLGLTQQDILDILQENYFSLGILILLAILAGFLSHNLLYKSLANYEIRRAIRLNQFEPYLQPIANAKDGSWIGVEILIRWVHSDGRVIFPDQFIPQAEQNRLITPMTSQLIVNVADYLQSFEAQLPDDFIISFNISAQNCFDFTLVEDCKKFLSHFKANKFKLILELTEREDIHRTEITDSLFNKLREMNVIIAMDDFGTSNSNLDYLEKFQINYLKIDRSFISKSTDSDLSRKIIEYIIDLSNRLNITVVAEGVETEVQRDYLLSKQVIFQQGYLFSKPLSKNKFKEEITQHRSVL